MSIDSPCKQTKPSDDVQALLDKAKKLVASNAFDDAHKALIEGIETHSKSWHLPLALGELVLQHSPNAEKAVVLLEQASHLGANQPLIWQRLGNAYDQNGQAKEALEAYHKALGLDEKNTSIYTDTAELLEQLDHLDEAASAYEEAIRQTIDAPDLSVYLHAHAFYARHDGHENALTIVQNAQKAFPEEAMLHFLEGVCLESLEKKEDAETAYAKALEKGGGSPELHRQMATYFAQQGEPMKAITHLISLLELAPEDTDALEALAHLLMDQQMPAKALQLLTRLLDITPTHANALILSADIYQRLNQPNKAIDALNGAIEASQKASLDYRKALVLPLFTPEGEAHTALKHRLQMSMKALSHHPATIQNPSLDIGTTPQPARRMGLWDDRLEADWRRALGKIQRTTPPKKRDVDTESHTPTTPSADGLAITRVVIASRFMNADAPKASLWMPFVNQLDRSQFDVTWLSLGQAVNPPAGVKLHEDDAQLSVALHEWEIIESTLHDLAPDILCLTDVDADITTTALALGRYAPVQVALNGCSTTLESKIDAVFNPAAAPLPPIGENTKRFKVDFGANYGYPLLCMSTSPRSLTASVMEVFKTVLTQEEKAQVVLFHHESHDTEALMQAHLASLLMDHPDVLNRLSLMNLRNGDELRLLHVADAVLDLNVSHDSLSIMKAVSYGTPVFALCDLEQSADGQSAHYWHTQAPETVHPFEDMDALMQALTSLLQSTDQERDVAKPARQGQYRHLFAPANAHTLGQQLRQWLLEIKA